MSTKAGTEIENRISCYFLICSSNRTRCAEETFREADLTLECINLDVPSLLECIIMLPYVSRCISVVFMCVCVCMCVCVQVMCSRIV